MNKLYLGILLFLTINLSAQSIQLTEFSSGHNWLIGLANDGSENLYTIQKTGEIFLVDNEGNRSAQPFLDISSRVRAGINDERGLLGVAFHPDYEGNGFFYVYYNAAVSGDITISRFIRLDETRADPDSEVRLLSFPHPRGNHIGGGIQFGADGFLYAGVGDGGGQGDPDSSGQNLGVFQGKILRIDVSPGNSYTVPPDNPFVNTPGARPEIWAYGLRNPWRFDFDDWTGDLWITDVGQDEWEEVNLQLKESTGGENYGWSCRDANEIFRNTECAPGEEYLDPHFQYPHVNGNCGGSISGGVAYRGVEYGDLFGNFFFTDFCTGNIFMVDKAGNSIDFGTFEGFEYTTINENHLGEMFMTAFSTNRILQIESENPAPTAIITNGTDVLICENAEVTLGAYNLPAATHITYAWMRDGVMIPDATSPGLLVSEAGNYQVVVTNNNNGGQNTSEPTLVTLGDAPVVEMPQMVTIGDTFMGIVINGDTTITRIFTSSIGCDSTVQYIINGLSSTNNLLESGVEANISPNPFHNQLVIDLELRQATNMQLDLLDLSGKKVEVILPETRLNVGNHQQIVNLSHLPKGVYLIRGKTGNSTFSKRIVRI